MIKQAVGDGPMCARRRFRIWAFFGILLAALICSAVVGSQSVRADATCTSQQCSDASNYADAVCLDRGSFVNFFKCPSNSLQNDDFVFFCGDSYHELDDCDGSGPS